MTTNTTGGGPGRETSAASCGCGVPDCGQHASGFTRPRFFSGQLLTEDDLQLLTQYVVDKNRLHNRFFMGDGVVCGLEVGCHPCSDSKIVVKPGYALDCCGNDVVVSCEQQLDALELIRALRERQMAGYDCQDPCAGETSRKKSPAQRYGLYLVYGEQQDELVMPYTSGDACGRGACEASRVREGFHFELRCYEEQRPTQDIASRLLGCFAWMTTAAKTIRAGAKTQRDAKKMAEALEATNGASITFSEVHAQRMKAARPHVERALKETKPDAESLVRGAEHIAEYAGMHVRLRSASIDDGTMAKLDLSAEIEAGDTVLADASSWLEYGAEDAVELIPLERAYVASVQQMTAVDAVASDDKRVWAEGVAYSQSLQEAYFAALYELRQAMLTELNKGKSTTDCQLRHDIEKLKLPVRGARVGAEVQKRFVGASDGLIVAMLRVVLDCVCAALNPPCEPCDDVGVLLACFSVEDCKVDTICNTSRKYVLTANAMRYWMPLLGWLGELLEHACCTFRGLLSDAESYRGLAAVAGMRLSRGSIESEMGAVQVLSALRGYYGSAAPSESQLRRVPAVLTTLSRIALTQMGVDDVAVREDAPAGPATISEEELGETVRRAVDRTFAKEWKRRLDAHADPLVEGLVVEKVPAALADALTEGAIRPPVVAYLDRHLRTAMREVAQPVLRDGLRPVVETLARERVTALAGAEVEKAVERDTPPLVRRVVGEVAAAEVDEVLIRRAPDVLDRLAGPTVERVAGALITESVSSALDDQLAPRVAAVTLSALETALADDGGGRAVVREVTEAEVERRVAGTKKSITELKTRVTTHKREATKALNAYKRELDKKLTANVGEVDSLAVRATAIEEQLEALTAKLEELTRG